MLIALLQEKNSFELLFSLVKTQRPIIFFSTLDHYNFKSTINLLLDTCVYQLYYNSFLLHEAWWISNRHRGSKPPCRWGATRWCAPSVTCSSPSGPRAAGRAGRVRNRTKHRTRNGPVIVLESYPTCGSTHLKVFFIYAALFTLPFGCHGLLWCYEFVRSKHPKRNQRRQFN